MQKRVLKIHNIDALAKNNYIGLVGDVLSLNGLVVFPSDTVLGIFAKVSKEGIDKVDKFKNRPKDKNYSLISSDLQNLKKLIDLPPKNFEIIGKNVPGLFTFVVKPTKLHSTDIEILLSSEGKLGFRIPTSNLMLEVARRCPFPVLATSANLSSQPSVHSFSDLEDQFRSGNLLNHLNLIDLLLDLDSPYNLQSSTVVDLTTNPPTILRKGSGKLVYPNNTIDL
jgi:L-threonylcarbamoyladenylate synthase